MDVYPYLLPCAVTAVITLLGEQYNQLLKLYIFLLITGSILSLFLGRDGAL